MKRAIYTTVEQFLTDDDFIRYVMDSFGISEGLRYPHALG